MLGGKMVMEKLMTVFEDKKLQGRQKVLNKAAKIVLKKAEIQKRKLDKVALTQVWNRFMKSEGWEAKKELCLVRQATIISSEICNGIKNFFFLLKKGVGMIIIIFFFLDECPKHNFF